MIGTSRVNVQAQVSPPSSPSPFLAGPSPTGIPGVPQAMVAEEPHRLLLGVLLVPVHLCWVRLSARPVELVPGDRERERGGGEAVARTLVRPPECRFCYMVTSLRVSSNWGLQTGDPADSYHELRVRIVRFSAPKQGRDAAGCGVLATRCPLARNSVAWPGVDGSGTAAALPGAYRS